jgi:hypothetical protein
MCSAGFQTQSGIKFRSSGAIFNEQSFNVKMVRNLLCFYRFTKRAAGLIHPAKNSAAGPSPCPTLATPWQPSKNHPTSAASFSCQSIGQFLPAFSLTAFPGRGDAKITPSGGRRLIMVYVKINPQPLQTENWNQTHKP